MRILHLSTFLQGGAGRAITNLALEQARAGSEVAVVASLTGVPGYENYPTYLDALRKGGVEVELVDSMFDRDTGALFNVVRALDRRYVRGAEPDLIHAHAAMASLVGLLFAGSRGHGRVVQTMHGWGITKTPAQAAIDVAILNLVDRVFVPSNHAVRQLTELGVRPGLIERIHYAIGEPDVALTDGDQAVCRALRAAGARGALAAVCIGTIGERKNQQLIVDAVGRLANPWSVYCVMLGDGDIDGLRASVSKAGLEGSIHVHGFSPAARLIAREADVLVLPSRNEGQPLAVLEALADGLPVVVAGVPELKEIVQHGVNGLHFRPEDPDDLAAALNSVEVLAELKAKAG